VSKLTGMLILAISIGLAAIGILLRPTAPAVVEVMPTPTLPRPVVWYSPTPTAARVFDHEVEPTPTPVVLEHVVQLGESFWVIVHDLCQPPIDIDVEVRLVNYNLMLNGVFLDTTIRPAEVLQIQCVLP
tara:strand:+ start:332 stop:718 length:387 start_codon:yes stop_codon:yes gene_type:complete